MTKVYLFDWGNTLMVDFPGQEGKMCDWPHVEAVDGAKETLENLSKSSAIYIATNAADSSEDEIRSAFERAGLSEYISGYFCRANIGIAKGTAEFYEVIVGELGVEAHEVTMVGDIFENDISPALEAGLSAVWFNPETGNKKCAENLMVIKGLRELCA